MTHVFVRLSGFGVRLLPYWPYSFARVPDSPTAVTVRDTIVDPATAASIEGVVDVSPGPDTPYWTIETTAFSVPWPDGFTLEAPEDLPFLLVGPHDIQLFPRGRPAPNEDVPQGEAWAAPGQSVTDTYTAGAASVVELVYEHDGQSWWQGHWQLPYGPNRSLIFTAQAPWAYAQNAREAANVLAIGLAI